MTTQTPQIATEAAAPLATDATTATPATTTVTTSATNCTECDARIQANVALPGEILDCPDCGVELEVRSVSPLVLALAPTVEEDWGE
jgi:alpha-aminoadipate/glutamate carrier protein LysW